MAIYRPRGGVSSAPLPPMHSLVAAFRFALALGVLYALSHVALAEAASEWAATGADGKLRYKALPKGDRIIDFSFAGYMGGGVALPAVPVRKALKPSGGDDSSAIQAAIDEVGQMPAISGLRGAVLLEQGRFHCSTTVVLRVDGVVLRGSGSGEQGTIVEMIGAPHAFATIGESGRARSVGKPVSITDAYVPSGSRTISVADAAGFKVGDTILVIHPAPAAWVNAMGMDALTRDGKKQTWVGGDLTSERTVVAITDSKVTVDVPLSDSLDASLLSPPGASVTRYTPPERVRQVGIESVRILSPPQPVALSDPKHSGVRVGAAEDVWIRDLVLIDTVGSVSFSKASRRATAQEVSITHSVAPVGSAKPADLACDGSQLLFDRCSGKGDNLFHFVTGSGVSGPNVLLNSKFQGNGRVQPHQRWATGLLFDQCEATEGGIDLMNRGQMGSGHGWTIGWAVAWNCVAKSFIVQQPPGSMNWAIGCRGQRDLAAMPFGKAPKLAEGTFDSHGTPVLPASLYLAQLRDRLGPQALKNIGY